MRFSHQTGDFLIRQEIFSWGGCTRKCPVSWENLMSQENISCLISFGSPSPTRKSPVSCLMRKYHVSRENLMTQENISNLIIFGSPPNEKIFCLLSHEKISCLKRKSDVSREYLISYHFWSPLNEKISCLLSHEKMSWPKRKSYVLSV